MEYTPKPKKLVIVSEKPTDLVNPNIRFEYVKIEGPYVWFKINELPGHIRNATDLAKDFNYLDKKSGDRYKEVGSSDIYRCKGRCERVGNLIRKKESLFVKATRRGFGNENTYFTFAGKSNGYDVFEIRMPPHVDSLTELVKEFNYLDVVENNDKYYRIKFEDVLNPKTGKPVGARIFKNQRVYILAKPRK
ncbi:MAG: hypothetical protein QXS07_01265 [Candidatus Pacearchaeota archaeon]